VKGLIVIVLILISTTCYAQETTAPKTEQQPQEQQQKQEITPNPDEDDKFLKEIYENMSPQIKRLYMIPQTQTAPEKTDKPATSQEPQKPPVIPTPTPKQQKTATKQQETTTKKPEQKPKDTFEKILDFLFGSKPQTPITAKPTEEKEPLQREITAKEEEQQIEGLKPLQQIIENAKANSPEIQKAKIEAEIIRRQNTFTPVPTFSVGNDFATGKMIISAGVQLPLEPLFTGKQREKYGLLLIKQKELEVEQKVIDQYTVVKQIKEKIKTREEKAKYAQQLVKIAEEQYKGGLIKLDELIKAKDTQWQIRD